MNYVNQDLISNSHNVLQNTISYGACPTFFPSSNLFINYVSLQQASNLIPNSCHLLITWTVVIILNLQVILGLCQQLGLGLSCNLRHVNIKQKEAGVPHKECSNAAGRVGEIRTGPVQPIHGLGKAEGGPIQAVCKSGGSQHRPREG